MTFKFLLSSPFLMIALFYREKKSCIAFEDHFKRGYTLFIPANKNAETLSKMNFKIF